MSVVAGILPDGPLALYLALGMVAAVNPCGFAMLPAYLTYFLGTEDSGTAGDRAMTAGVPQAARVALAVSGGFMAVFALAGTAVELTALPVYDNLPWISIVIGLALLVLGIAMLFGFQLSARLPKLERGGRTRSLGSMFVFGVSYAVASIGCTLPIFLSAVAGTVNRESLYDGIGVFAIYGLGMTLVLVALTVAMALARTSLLRFLRGAQAYVGRVAGGLVAVAGGYVAYYGWLEVRTFGGSTGTGAVPASNITDVVTGWSYDISDRVNSIGSLRIAVGLSLALAVLALIVFLRHTQARRRLTPMSVQDPPAVSDDDSPVPVRHAPRPAHDMSVAAHDTPVPVRTGPSDP